MAYLGPAFEAVRGAKLFSRPGERESWPFAIQVRLPRLGVLGRMGTIDIDARTGEVLPLTHFSWYHPCISSIEWKKYKDDLQA